MKYGIFFLLLAVIFIVCATTLRGWCLILIWPAISCLIVSSSYFGLGPGVYGKRANGTMAPISIIFLLPYLLFLWLIWHVVRLVSRETPVSSVANELLIGRRLLAHELPNDVDVVVDLTCEFPEPKAIRRHANYVSIPVLDASAPEPQALFEQILKLAQMEGQLLIHCAQGHGRSGLVAALLLMAKNETKFDMAIALVKNSRPGVELNRQQMAVCKATARMIDTKNAAGIQ